MAKPPLEWSAILADAVEKPGVISQAYRRFWIYSVGNQLLALFQCMGRGIEPGPINTFLGWKVLGRSVQKGGKALTLCMPVKVKARGREAVASNLSPTTAAAKTEADEQTLTLFVYKPHWYVLSQTQGREYIPQALPDWDEARAFQALGISRETFRHTDGNAQGYASGRSVAVSPVAFAPHRTLFHELAHVVLGHTAEIERLIDAKEATPRDLREAEAECVALICTESLDLSGSEFSRGYIQHWLRGQTIPTRSAQRIFKAADEILRAGRPASEGGEA